MTWKYSDHVRCGCPGPDKEQLGQSCPQLWRKDGSRNVRHRTAGFTGRIPTSAGTKPLQRFDHPSRKAAQAAAHQDDAGVDQNLRVREAGNAGRPVNDRRTPPQPAD